MTIDDFLLMDRLDERQRLLLHQNEIKTHLLKNPSVNQVYSESVFGPPVCRILLIVYLLVYTWQQPALLVMDNSLVSATNNKA